MAINYLRRVQARYQGQGQSDVERGIQAGQTIGKLLGGLGTAIQGAQKNALANKLMTDQAIASQPGAGQTQDLGTLPGGPQPGGPQPSSSGPDPDPDPMANPVPSSVNPDYQPYSFTDMPDTSVSDAVAQQKTAAALPSAQPAPAPSDFSLNPSDYSGGGKTVGGLIHTGGTQELDLQKEMLAMQGTRQAQALAAQKGQMDLADQQAEASGTGRYAVDAALKRAQLLAAQTKALNPKTAVVKPEDIPITNLDSEPVNNQGQLNKYIDTAYGKGASGALASTVMNPETIPNPKAGQPNEPDTIPNPNGPQVSADGQTVTVGPKNRRITMPIGTAQILVKQQNSLNYKQKQPLLRVPGEDQTQGSKENPYPIKSKVDMVSRASGTWVRLPSGQIAQVP